MKTVREYTYLGDRVSEGGGCEAAVTARTRCGWIMLRVFGKLLYGRGFPLRLKVYGSEAWCLKESEKGILRRTERSMVRAMCGVQQNI